MDAGQSRFPSREELTQRVLRFLEACALRRAERAGYDRSRRDVYEPLISIERDGVHVHLSGIWWVHQTPFTVLSILRLLEVPVVNAAEVATWIKQQQEPSGLFRSDTLGFKPREATYNACVMLHMLGVADDDAGWDKRRLVELLRAQQGEHPSVAHRFSFLPGDDGDDATESGVAYCCIGSLAALGETLRYPETAIAHIQSKQEAFGAFSTAWRSAYRAWPSDSATVDAVRCLALLNSGPLDAQACIAQVQSWQYADGGYHGYPTGDRVQTGHSGMHGTFAAVTTLALLGAAPRNLEACRQRIRQLWVPEEGGFMSHVPHHPLVGAEPEPTCLGLLVMASLGMLGPARPHWREMLMLSGRSR